MKPLSALGRWISFW